jgi:hypothetical protein
VPHNRLAEGKKIDIKKLKSVANISQKERAKATS